MGGGAAWLDFDQDGDPDLYLVSGQPVHSGGTFPGEGKNKLYRNDSGKFVDVTAGARVAGHGYGLGAAVGDIDNDGYPDLFVICFGPGILYRNHGDGTFEEVLSSGIRGVDPFSGSARSLALGSCSLTLSDPYSILNNQAAMAFHPVSFRFPGLYPTGLSVYRLYGL